MIEKLIPGRADWVVQDKVNELVDAVNALQSKELGTGAQQPLNAIALLEEWVVLENQREGCKPEYSRDLSKRTYAVLAQQQ